MERPLIGSYESPADFVRDMIRYRKSTDPDFSVLRAARPLRRVSPALVSLVARGKRNLTLDRTDEFSRLMGLNAAEKTYFRNWIGRLENKDFVEPEVAPRSSRDVGTHILNDWVNVYVKDLFQLAGARRDPASVERQLIGLVSAPRIRRSIDFLLREGYLRRKLDGSIMLETQLAVAETPVPSAKIRQFHKAALTLARQALDLYPKEERIANTLIVALDDDSRKELEQIMSEFSERLKEFAARPREGENRLYQLIVNLSPVGGKLE